MPRNTEVVAVVNTEEERIAVWYVHTAPEIPIARLCGSWVILDRGNLRKLLTDRSILFVDDDPIGVSAEATDLSAVTMDPNATLCSVRATMAELQGVHENSLTAGGKKREPVKWPTLPAPIEWSTPPLPRHGVTLDDKLVATTIGVANWVVTLAESWRKIETIRTSRKHLCGGDSAVRPLPIVAAQQAST